MDAIRRDEDDIPEEYKKIVKPLKDSTKDAAAPTPCLDRSTKASSDTTQRSANKEETVDIFGNGGCEKAHQVPSSKTCCTAYGLVCEGPVGLDIASQKIFVGKGKKEKKFRLTSSWSVAPLMTKVSG